MPLRRLFLLLLCSLLLTQSLPSTAATLELLRNGGFDQGTSGWYGSGLSSTGCAPAAGPGALSISSAGLNPFAAQNVAGPLGSGAYSLTGLVMAPEGSPNVVISLLWFDEDDRELHSDLTSLSAGPSYSSFRLNASGPAGAASLQVRISVSGQGNDGICLDNVNLNGPPPPSPTPTVTPTPSPSPSTTPSPQPSPTSTPTRTPTSTSTPKPTSTPQPTATLPPLTPTPQTAAPTQAEESSPEATSTTGAQESVAPQPISTAPRTEPTPVQAVLSVAATSTPAGPVSPLVLTQSATADDGVPLIWLAGGALFVAALGSSYVYAKRR